MKAALLLLLGLSGWAGVLGAPLTAEELLEAAETPDEAQRVPLPEQGMRAAEIIAYNGYPVEYHNVTTSDGYVLTVVRIPHGREGSDGKPRPPVFLQHGLGASCMNWVTNLPDQSLGFILADQGYDVYLGNCRGNSYSLGHQTLDHTKDKAFWDFTWQDMAAKDLPAMVEAALEINGEHAKLAYVGHSQGTLIAFTHFSAEPEWTAAHVNHFVALAPVYYLGKVTSPLHILAPFGPEIYDLVQLTGGLGTTNNQFLGKYIKPVCKNEWIYKYVCSRLEFFILGKELPKNINQTRLPVFFGGGQGGTSIKNYLAFAEGIDKPDTCRQFDYLSEKKNHDVYGCWQFEDWKNCPPSYHVENIQVPMNIFWSDADELADPQDAFNLINRIPHQYRRSKLINGYSHVDFLWATNVVETIYDEVQNVFKALDFGLKSQL